MVNDCSQTCLHYKHDLHNYLLLTVFTSCCRSATVPEGRLYIKMEAGPSITDSLKGHCARTFRSECSEGFVANGPSERSTDEILMKKTICNGPRHVRKAPPSLHHKRFILFRILKCFGTFIINTGTLAHYRPQTRVQDKRSVAKFPVVKHRHGVFLLAEHERCGSGELITSLTRQLLVCGIYSFKHLLNSWDNQLLRGVPGSQVDAH